MLYKCSSSRDILCLYSMGMLIRHFLLQHEALGTACKQQFADEHAKSERHSEGEEHESARQVP